MAQRQEWYEPLLDGGWVPDMVVRTGIRRLVGERSATYAAMSVEQAKRAKMDHIHALNHAPIAIHTDKANEQHYEMPTEFWAQCLGPRFKYSCALYESDSTTLAEAEVNMLEVYCERAQLKDGLDILDCGCGWGSLALYLCEKYPKSKITALSNSKTQKEYIDGVAKSKGFKNITVFTDDVRQFDTKLRFDRVMTIEMLEHMKNYSLLFEKMASWLKPQGTLFIQTMAHSRIPYHFETEEDNSWMSRYFFTGGTMPSDDLFLYFQDKFTILDHWIVNGSNYGKTCEAWLKLYDQNASKIMPILAQTYGGDDKAKTWFNCWRVYLMACAETFAFNNGQEWVLAHYLFKKR